MNQPISFESPMLPQFDTLAIIGVGLLGGSVARATKQRGLVRRIIGVGRNTARLEEARAAGVIDVVETSLRVAASQADLLIFATPVDHIAAGVREAASACRIGAILTDVGSTKGHLCRELSTGLPNAVTFVGSHPLAGSEKQGWEHSLADLFEGRVCVVTPIDAGPEARQRQIAAVSQLTHFWQRIGMRVIELSPEAHDRALAQTSHLPHVVASALARTLDESNRPFAATGFADTTRIAAGDPNVWVPILLDNSAAILASLDDYTQQLQSFREALNARDAEALRRLWDHGKIVRDSIRIRRVSD
ncbi:MAG: prephenate dehydrogenase/arogenate dehydrogenase family protein [Planctomycetia bacterium]|nr:prephenate dehydrogenase/arogenate dehydrogenase family protein [Planctomycetia bacterium]